MLYGLGVVLFTLSILTGIFTGAILISGDCGDVKPNKLFGLFFICVVIALYVGFSLNHL